MSIPQAVLDDQVSQRGDGTTGSGNPPRDPWHPALRHSAVQRWALAALVAALGATLLGLGWRGAYFHDDFLNLGLALQYGLTLHYLFISNFGNLEPGFRLVYFVLARLPYEYRFALLFAVACYAVALLFFFRILTALFGYRWWNLLFVFFVGASTLWLQSVFSTAASLNIMPASALVMVTMDAYLRYCSSRSWRHLLVMLVAFVVALGFYEKALLLVVELPLLSLVLELRRPFAAGLLALLRRYALPWGMMLALGVAYVAFYITRGYGTVAGHPGPISVVDALVVGWFDSFVPGLLGGPLNWANNEAIAYAYPIVAWAVIAQAVIISTVVVSVARRWAAWRAWAFFIVMAGASFGMVVIARVGEFGVDIGRDSHYVADIAYLFWLALAIALLPSRLDRAVTVAVGRRSALAPGRRRRSWKAGWVISIMALGIAARVTIFGVSAVDPSMAWAGDNVATRYLANVSRTLPPPRDRALPTVYDDTVPSTVVPNFEFPYNRLSSVLAVADRSRVSVAEVGTPEYYVRNNGSVAPATFRSVADLLARPPSAIHLRSVAPSAGGALCTRGTAGSISVDLGAALPVATWFAEIRYQAPVAFQLYVLQTDKTGASLAVPWELPGGDHVAMLPLTSDTVTKAGVELLAADGQCFNQMLIGRPTEAVTH